MKTLAERLRWARDRKGMTQGGLAAKIGRKQGYIGNLEAGTRLNSMLVSELAEVLGVNAVWLSTGRGLPLAEPDQSKHLALIYATDAEIQLLTAYRETDETGRDAFATLANNVPRKKLHRVDQA